MAPNVLRIRLVFTLSQLCLFAIYLNIALNILLIYLDMHQPNLHPPRHNSRCWWYVPNERDGHYLLGPWGKYAFNVRCLNYLANFNDDNCITLMLLLLLFSLFLPPQTCSNRNTCACEDGWIGHDCSEEFSKSRLFSEMSVVFSGNNDPFSILNQHTPYTPVGYGSGGDSAITFPTLLDTSPPTPPASASQPEATTASSSFNISELIIQTTQIKDYGKHLICVCCS